MTDNLFISWSGSMSQAVAAALRDWLPSVIQAVKPWLSSADLEKGVRWSTVLSEKLERTDVGIICLTPDSLGAPWMLFEAGALSKSVQNARVFPYLVGIESRNVKGPLTQFQLTRADKDDTAKLLSSINGVLGDSALSEKQLEKSFEVWWPVLEEQLRDILKAGGEQAAPPKRSQEEILEEILSIVRGLAREQEEQQREAEMGRIREKLLSVVLGGAGGQLKGDNVRSFVRRAVSQADEETLRTNELLKRKMEEQAKTKAHEREMDSQPEKEN